jgi:hypothetical protein
MRTQYRVVRDNYAGFEVQCRRWWWPFWCQCGINTHSSLKMALAFIDGLRGHVVWTEEGGRA